MGVSRVDPADALQLTAITFEWAESLDTKDWARLGDILAPELTVDYTEVTGQKWDAMSAKDFVAMVSDVGFVGDPLVDSQHFIGASKYEVVSEDCVVGSHQLRAAHQRYTGPDKKTVEAKGHCHALMQHTYLKIGGDWKLAGLKPKAYWNEFDFDKIFPGNS
ncbi:Pituitary homeobox 2 [Fusarium equiseti]|uniref:Pituitary homeobox 2 n=1 Tax=Fusarium equiseti TaxID=61235 RepID=A0ABQ8R8G4_FUSEQ|nr:Pituitary homeobox 2 [Fusarium equiseti]